MIDPLLAKVMTHGRDRTEAIAMMHDALSGQTRLQGPMNNLDFLDAVISSQREFLILNRDMCDGITHSESSLSRGKDFDQFSGDDFQIPAVRC